MSSLACGLSIGFVELMPRYENFFFCAGLGSNRVGWRKLFPVKHSLLDIIVRNSLDNNIAPPSSDAAPVYRG